MRRVAGGCVGGEGERLPCWRVPVCERTLKLNSKRHCSSGAMAMKVAVFKQNSTFHRRQLQWLPPAVHDAPCCGMPQRRCRVAHDQSCLRTGAACPDWHTLRTLRAAGLRLKAPTQVCAGARSPAVSSGVVRLPASVRSYRYAGGAGSPARSTARRAPQASASLR